MVYFISGLGADHRLFKNLDLAGIEHCFLDWLSPLENENFTAYVNRLLEGIDQTQEIILVGVSFGGIVAQEIAHRLPVKKVILISSVKSEKEFDVRIKTATWLRPDLLLPGKLMKWSAKLAANYFFSIRTKQDAAFLAELIKDADPWLIKWSVSKILQWKSAGPVPNLLHLHGSHDRVFPLSKIANPIEVPGGGHFMIADKAPEISKLLRKVLS